MIGIMKNNTKSLALFMTQGMSLLKWDRVGMLDREIDLYNNLAGHFDHLYIFSYGVNNESLYSARLHSHITVVPKRLIFSDTFYQFVIPIIHHNILKSCRFLKTNQIDGSVPAVITKMFCPTKKLIVRSGYIATLNAKLYRKGYLWRVYIRILEFFAYRLCNLAFIPTPENAEYLTRQYPFLRHKIQIMNNSIRTDIFSPRAADNKFDVGYVGRLNKDKNLMNLLISAKDTGWRIGFVGQGEEKDNLIDYAKENNIDLTIIDRIPNHELPGFYNQLTVFVFPSLHEGNPKTLLEAMACGRPVVAGDVVGVRNIVNNGHNGILIEPNASEIRSSIQQLLGDRTKREVLAHNARAYIEENYNFTTLLKKELAVYETLD